MLRALCFLFLGLFGAGCSCAPFGLEGKTFACSRDEDCNDGYECRDGLCMGEIDAGFDAGLDAGELPDAGAEDAGSDAGELPDAGFIDDDGGLTERATRLVFTSSPPLVHVGDCSAAFVIESRDDADVTTPAVNALTVSLRSTGDGGVQFFTANTCATQATQVTLTPGQSIASFYVRGTRGGTVQLIASAPSLTSASTDLTFAPDPDTLFFVAPLSNQFAGDCDVLNLEARTGTTPQPVAVNTDVTFTSTPSGGSRIYSDAACSTPITGATIVAGGTSTNVYVKTITGGTNVIKADAPWDSTQISISTTGLVRRVGCGFSDATYLSDGGVNTTQLATQCSIVPRVKDYNRTMLFQNSWGTVGALSAAQAKCRIETGSTTTQVVSCQRRGYQGRLNALMHAMEIPGASVRRISLSCAVPSVSGVTTPTLDPDSTFVLKTLINDGYGLTDEDTPWTWLDSGLQVSLNMPADNPCVAAELQLVQIPGITVTRGELDGGALGPGDTSFTLTGLPLAGPNRVVLVQPSTTSTSENVSFCNAFVRAELPTGTTMTLSRGAGSSCVSRAVEHLAWQRIDFGTRAKVDAYTVQLDAGVTVVPVTVSRVDPTRSFVFTGTELGFGQNGGESDSPLTAAGGDINANFGLDGGAQVMVQRGSGNSTARYTFYVVQWNL